MLGTNVKKMSKNNFIFIEPTLSEIFINGSNENYPIPLKVTNNSENNIVINVSAIDFGTQDNSKGKPILNTKLMDKEAFGVKDFIKFERDVLRVNAGESITVNAILENSDQLFSGGHYGAILVNIQNEESNEDVIDINYTLSSLLFINKESNETLKLVLEEASLNNTVWSLPNSVKLKFSNNNDHHLIPRGVVKIESLFDHLINKGSINLNSERVLPKTNREMPTNLQTVADYWIPGFYKLEVSYRHNASSKLNNYQKTIFIGWGYYLIFLACLIALFVIKKRRAAKHTSE